MRVSGSKRERERRSYSKANSLSMRLEHNSNDFPSNVLRCVVRQRTCSMLWPSSLLSRVRRCLSVFACVCVCAKKPAKQAAERERERLHWKVNKGRKKNRLTGQQIMLRYILRAGMLSMMYIYTYMYVRLCVRVCVELDNNNNTFNVLLYHTHAHLRTAIDSVLVCSG